MKKFNVCARVSSLAILMLVIATTFGCGGGGSDPILTPPPVTPPAPTGAVITGFRLQMTDTTINSGGKAIYESMPYGQKIIDIPDSGPVELRFRLEAEIGGQWFLSTGLDTTRIDIRIIGIESGEFAPQLMVLPPHDQSFTDTMVWWVEPGKGSGRIDLVAEIHAESGGILCSLAFGLYLYGNEDSPPPPPPPPSCRDLHPVKEAINGYWWDCVNGEWINTGEPVEEDPPLLDTNLYPTPNGAINAYYDDIGLQSIPLEVYSPGMESIGFILWEIVSGPSGAMTVPIGSHPFSSCEFYYENSGIYIVQATPYPSEASYQNNDMPIGSRAIFTITVIDG